MPDSMRSDPAADQNLLFGVLALQMEFIGRDHLIAGMQAWVFDKSKSLGRILQAQGALDEEERTLLESLVDKHLRRHGGDPQQSLAAVPTTASICQDLSGLNDPDVQARIAQARASGAVLPETVAESGGGKGLRYRILRPHARGGLGEVFVALDQELKREVAVKEIQPQHAHDPVCRSRFVQEAEITGGLEHPGIVPVYGLGKHPDGRPFYAMRFIQGDNLKEAIERFHAADRPARDPGERSLALRQLLGRFVALCNAVAYAHSRGVLHRDLKPGNVMLGKFGETLVVDWGLAKTVGRGAGAADSGEATLHPGSADDREATQAGRAVGTPTFMSPEQAAGRHEEVGPASDVYGLGGTLCMLLTGQTPVRGTDSGEILRKVQRGDLDFPRPAKGRIPPALAAVCRKAMALKPNDRYASALNLAADVEHWLADEPVAACPEPWAARAGRWVRRHRTAAAGTAAAVGVAAVCLAVATVLLTAARDSEHRAKLLAEQNEQKAEKQRDRARDHFLLARTAVDTYYTRVSDSPELKAHGLEKLRTRLLETAADFYEKLVQKEEADAGVQAERGRSYLRLGKLYQDTGRHQKADGAFRQSLAIWKRLAEELPTLPRPRAEMAELYHRLGWLHQNTGRNPEAEKAHLQSLSLWEKLIAQYPDEPVYQSFQGWTYNDLGILYANTNRTDKAKQAHDNALALRLKLVSAQPNNDAYVSSLAASHANLGALHLRGGRWGPAEKAYRQSAEIRQSLASRYPDSPEHLGDLAGALYNLGFAFDRDGKKAEAEGRYKEAMGVQEKLAGEHPTVLRYQTLLADTQNMLASLYKRTNRRAEAGALFQKSLENRERLAQAHPTVPKYAVELGGSYCNRGALLVQLQDYPAAERSFASAVKTLQAVLQKEDTNSLARNYLLTAYQEMGNMYRARGLKEEAEAAYRNLAETVERLVRDNPGSAEYGTRLGGSFCNLGHRLRENNKPKLAVESYSRAVRTLEGLLQKEAANKQAQAYLSYSLSWRGQTLSKSFNCQAEALQDLERASTLAGRNDRDWINAMRAGVLARSGDYRQAVTVAAGVGDKKSATGDALLHCAYAYALAAPAALKDTRLSAEGRDLLADQYASRAVDLLSRSAAMDYFTSPAEMENLKSNSDLDPIRSRTEFEKLLAKLENSNKARDRQDSR